MRKLWIMLLLGLLVMAPLALAQDEDEDAEATAEVTAEPEAEVTAEADDTEESQEDSLFERVEGELTALLAFEYEFEAVEDEVITLVVRSLDAPLDLQISVLDEEGEVIAESDPVAEPEDDALDVYDAFISGLEIPADGIYTIQVSNAFFGEGQIELLIVRGDVALGDAEDASALTDAESTAEPDAEPTESLTLADLGIATATPIPAIQRRTTGPCTASVNSIPARLRNFPSLEQSRVAGELYPDRELPVEGQYFNEAENMIWYRVGEGLWVRQDTIQLNGNCTDIPPIFL